MVGSDADNLAPPIRAQLPANRQVDSLPHVAHAVDMTAAQSAALLCLAPDDTLLREQVRQCHADLDDATAMWLHKPRGSMPWSPPIRLYLHALCIEDITIHSVLRDGSPLFTSFWPNLYGPAEAVAVRQYARAVHASTDAYLAGLPSDGLSTVVDLRNLGLGQRTVLWVIRRFVVQELGRICGEIVSGGDSSGPEQSRSAESVVAQGILA
jgi:hypothetical protein